MTTVSPNARVAAPWTVLVHMATGERLAASGTSALAEMATATRRSALRIAVELHQGKRRQPKRFEIEAGRIHDVAERAFAYRPERGLRDAIDWATADARGPFALVVWGEGGGWISPRGLTPELAVRPIDEELRASIGLSRRGYVDVLGFDACLMGEIEILYGARKVAGSLVASEGYIPLTGWPYAKVFGLLGTARTPAAWAKDVARLAGSRAPEAPAVAAFDSNEADALADAFRPLARALRASPKSAVLDARAHVIHVGNPFFVDIGSMLDELARRMPSAKVRRAAMRARAAMLRARKAIRAEGVANRGMTGLSIFFPPKKTPLIGSYDRLAFAEETGWGAFVRDLFEA